MSDFESLRSQIREAQHRHQAIDEHVRGLKVPYSRRGEMSIPAFKMAAGGNPATDGRQTSLKLMAKAAVFPIDFFFYDLEDAAPDHPEFKQFARDFVIEALRTGDFGERVVAFRPNNIRTSYFEEDVLQVLRGAGDRLRALVIPKSETADEVADVAKIVTRINELAGNTNKLSLEVLIESPRAFQEAQRIARIPQVSALIFGAWDFARTVGGEVQAESWIRDQLAARQLLPIIAASEGKEAVDAVTGTLPIRPPRPADLTPELYDAALEAADVASLDAARYPADFLAKIATRRHALDLAARDARDARAIGFAAKWILHPDQISVIQGAWVPQRARALEALQLTATYTRAALTGSGAEVDGNRLADKAVVGTDWWIVLNALKGGVLTDADFAETGYTFEQLRRTVVTRDAQVGR